MARRQTHGLVLYIFVVFVPFWYESAYSRCLSPLGGAVTPLHLLRAVPFFFWLFRFAFPLPSPPHLDSANFTFAGVPCTPLLASLHCLIRLSRLPPGKAPLRRAFTVLSGNAISLLFSLSSLVFSSFLLSSNHFSC